MDIKENSYIVNESSRLSDPIEKALFKYKDHPSILKVKEKVKGVEFHFSNVTNTGLPEKKYHPYMVTWIERLNYVLY